MHPESDERPCRQCGFDYDEVHPSEVPAMVRALANDYSLLLSADEEVLRQRPAPGVWSAVECVAHVRDVLLVQRDRVLLAMVEDEPEPTSMHVDERPELARYNREPIDLLLVQFGVSAGLFADQFGWLTDNELDRSIIYNYPVRTARTLAWVGVHMAHEMVHHLADANNAIGGTRDVIDLDAG